MNSTATRRRSRKAKGNVSLLSKIRDFNTNPNPKIKTAELIAFARELATLLESGIPVVEALRLIAEQRKGDPMARVVKRMIIDLHSGPIPSGELQIRPFGVRCPGHALGKAAVAAIADVMDHVP